METAAEAGEAEAEEVRKAQKSGRTVNMNPRKQECIICAARRKERTSHNATNRKNGAKQWPIKQGNQTKNLTNELWNLIEAESTPANPNKQLGGNTDTTTDTATSTPLEGNDNDTESTKPTNSDTVHTALQRRNHILGEIKKIETMTCQEGSASGRLKTAMLADLKKDLEAAQQDVPQPLPRNTYARKEKDVVKLQQEVHDRTAKIQILAAVQQQLEKDASEIQKRLEEAEMERDHAFNQMSREENPKLATSGSQT